ncbi:MAG: ZIP family metal transporter [Parvibaculaceae bacterium]
MPRLAFYLMPLALVAALVGILLYANPLKQLTGAAPPVEDVKVERVVLKPGLVRLDVRADGSQPVSIAQVQVDGAYRSFSMEPSGPIGRLGTARIDIPYPWIDAEAHHIVLITSTGAAFEHTIEVARVTPRWDGEDLGYLLLIGLVLGLAPVAAGLLFYPALRGAGSGVMQFVLALTVGLLAYLLIDTLAEGFELGGEATERLRARLLVIVSAAVTAGLLLALGRRGGKAPEGVALAFFIALGIGLHNFGEGLVVGAAIATGAAALASFLLTGFVIHNVSEGFGIAAPLFESRPPLRVFAGLAALAGLPAVLGTVLGAQSVGPYWTALCFGVGAGAILQVIIEVTTLLARKRGSSALLSAPSLVGAVCGLSVMYATALLV